MSNFLMQTVPALHDPVTGALAGLMGANGAEYLFPSSPAASNGSAPQITYTSILVRSATAGVGTTLTNPLIQAVGNVNDFTQISIQNLSASAKASSDHVAYPNNNINDLTGFANMGITSSGFADAPYTVTGQNEAYLFASAPSGASKSGSLVLATDSTGTNNNIDFYVNGFNKAKAAYSARIIGSNGLFQVAEGLALTGKTVSANGTTTTYTVAAKKNYNYLTSTAAAIAFTFPAASATIDGLLVTVVTDTSVATLTWSSTGATFVGAPAASVANTPIRMIYDHANLKWYPA